MMSLTFQGRLIAAKYNGTIPINGHYPNRVKGCKLLSLKSERGQIGWP